MIALLVLAMTGFQADGAASEKWTGRLTIGADTYAVTGDSRHDASGAAVFSLQISDSGGRSIRSITGVLRASGGQIVVDGKQWPVWGSISEALRQQLRSGIGTALSSAGYICQAQGKQRVCDSRTLVAISDSLSGRVRLVYNGQYIRSIRFFSLAEWTNPFGQYVSLSLDIR